ncbi:MAG: YkvA family protein, partial [Solirubrobacteraceae bacterium]
RALAGFIPDCLVLFRRILGDDRVPRRNKLLLGALIGYLAMPIDLVPDFIPIAGQLDDALLVAFVLRTLLRAGGPDLLREHWPGPTTSLNVRMRRAYGHAGRSSSD